MLKAFEEWERKHFPEGLQEKNDKRLFTMIFKTNWRGYQGHEALQQMRLEEDLRKIEKSQEKNKRKVLKDMPSCLYYLNERKKHNER